MPQDEIRTVHTFSSAFLEHVDLTLGRTRRGGGGGGGAPPPPPHLTTVGVWICLYVRGLKTLLKNNYKDFVIGLSSIRLVLF